MPERKPIRIERSVIRRSASNPDQAEGERTLFELDPAEVTQLIRQARGLIGDLEHLFKKAPRRRQRRLTR